MGKSTKAAGASVDPHTAPPASVPPFSIRLLEEGALNKSKIKPGHHFPPGKGESIYQHGLHLDNENTQEIKQKLRMGWKAGGGH